MATHRRARSEARPDRALARALDRVARNRTEGARGLAGYTLDVLEASVARGTQRSELELRSTVRGAARSLRQLQPAMGVFDRWAGEWAKLGRLPNRSLLEDRLRRWASEWRTRLREEPRRILAVAERRLRASSRVVTISRSTTVKEILTSMPGPKRPARVIVLESRPGGEGRPLARELARAGLAVTLVPDRHGPRAVQEADLLLIGADTIFADGSVVHKVGTRALALAAYRASCPVIVAAGTSKLVARNRPRGPLPALFDRTPARVIHEYWTDRGRISSSDWARRSPALR